MGRGMWNMFKRPDKLFYDSKRTKGPELLKEDENFVSPYRRVYGFVAPDDINAMDVEGGSLYIATPNNIYVYGLSAKYKPISLRRAICVTSLYLTDIFMHFSPRVLKCMTVKET